MEIIVPFVVFLTEFLHICRIAQDAKISSLIPRLLYHLHLTEIIITLSLAVLQDDDPTA